VAKKCLEVSRHFCGDAQAGQDPLSLTTVLRNLSQKIQVLTRLENHHCKQQAALQKQFLINKSLETFVMLSLTEFKDERGLSE